MSPDSNAPSIGSLVEEISCLSARISRYLNTSSQAHPTSGAVTTALPDTDEFEAVRAPLNDAALDLLRLVNGPERTLRSFFFSHYDLAALQVALDRGFFKHVPLPEVGVKSDAQGIVDNPSARSASIQQIADKAGMDPDRTARVMGLLATHRIFQRVPSDTDRYEHTAASASLATNKGLHAIADMQSVFNDSPQCSTQLTVAYLEWMTCSKQCRQLPKRLQDPPIRTAKRTPRSLQHTE